MALVYSCCFWFSLRLGGILIGAFSLIQAVFILIVTCVGYSGPKMIQEKILNWISYINLMSKEFDDNLRTDQTKNLGLIIMLTCIYILVCILYVYGAYKCNNILMMTYILIELIRLIALSILVINLLLKLKENTMDIGFLIGASVLGGFILLGMFYLWVCAANLPIVINEKEHDEYETTIMQLQQLLKTNKPRTLIGFNEVAWLNYKEESINDNIFVVSHSKQQIGARVWESRHSFQSEILESMIGFDHIDAGRNDLHV